MDVKLEVIISPVKNCEKKSVFGLSYVEAIKVRLLNQRISTDQLIDHRKQSTD